MANISITSVVALVMITCALVACILSLAVDRWAEFKVQDIRTYYGVINICVCRTGIPCVCVKFADHSEDVPDYFKACLAAVCLAFIGNVLAVFTKIGWILNVGSDSVTKILKVATIALLAFAVFWNFIAVVVFAAEDKSKQEDAAEKLGVSIDYEFGWAWGMAILAAILEIGGLVATGLSQKSE